MSARPEDIDARLVQAIRYTLGVHVTLDDAAKVRAALHAAGFVVEQGWQPIETAPRDGTRLLCYAPATEGRAAVVRNDYWWVRERGFALMRPTQPYTHWRPLPQPPKETGDEG